MQNVCQFVRHGLSSKDVHLIWFRVKIFAFETFHTLALDGLSTLNFTNNFLKRFITPRPDPRTLLSRNWIENLLKKATNINDLIMGSIHENILMFIFMYIFPLRTVQFDSYSHWFDSQWTRLTITFCYVFKHFEFFFRKSSLKWDDSWRQRPS